MSVRDTIWLGHRDDAGANEFTLGGVATGNTSAGGNAFSQLLDGTTNGFKTLFGFQPEPRIAVLVFGLFHGFGLATKLQDLQLSQEGLVPNMIAFNVGVEIGQFLALGAILLAMNFWRRTASFLRHAYATNVVLMTAGFVLAGYQLAGYFFGDAIA